MTEAKSETQEHLILLAMMSLAIVDASIQLRTQRPADEETDAERDADIAKARKILVDKLRANPFANTTDSGVSMTVSEANLGHALRVWSALKPKWKEVALKRAQAQLLTLPYGSKCLAKADLAKAGGMQGGFIVSVNPPWTVNIRDGNICANLAGNWKPVV